MRDRMFQHRQALFQFLRDLDWLWVPKIFLHFYQLLHFHAKYATSCPHKTTAHEWQSSIHLECHLKLLNRVDVTRDSHETHRITSTKTWLVQTGRCCKWTTSTGIGNLMFKERRIITSLIISLFILILPILFCFLRWLLKN